MRGVLAQEVESYLEHRRRRGFAAGTLRMDRYDLKRFLWYCRNQGVSDPGAVTPAFLDGFLVWLKTAYRCRGPGRRRGRTLAPATVMGSAGAVRSLFAFLVREGRLLLDPARHLAVGTPRSKALERAVAPGPFEAMLATVDAGTALGLRNRAMLEVLFGCGLRRSELVGLDLYDVDLTGRLLTVRRGKGGRSRVVPLEGQAWRALSRYIEGGRPELVSAHSGHALFLGERGPRLGGEGLHLIVVEAARRAGLARRVTPHHLRHGYATALVRGGADVRAVRELLGHTRIDTTEVYTHLDVEDLVREHRRTHPRERGR